MLHLVTGVLISRQLLDVLLVLAAVGVVLAHVVFVRRLFTTTHDQPSSVV